MGIDRKETGFRIRMAMDERGVSTKELAIGLGITVQAVWKYLNGASSPTLEHMHGIATRLGVTMDSLVAEKKVSGKTGRGAPSGFHI